MPHNVAKYLNDEDIFQGQVMENQDGIDVGDDQEDDNRTRRRGQQKRRVIAEMLYENAE